MKTSIDLIAPASAATAEKPHGPSMMGGFDMNTPEGRAGLKAAAAASEAKSGEMAFNYGVRKDGSIWAEYGTIDGERHCAGDMNWPLWAHADLKRRLDEQAHVAAATAKERQARELAEGENARLVARLEQAKASAKARFETIETMCKEGEWYRIATEAHVGRELIDHESMVAEHARKLAPAPAGGSDKPSGCISCT